MDTEKNVKTGNYVRCLREQKGWTQEELAYRVGVSSRTIGTWEAGTGSIKTDNIRKLAYEADKLIVRNMKSGRAFLITKNPLDYFGKYGKVYGYMRNDTGQFSSKSKEIFYANNPAWIVEWFKKD